MVRDTGRRPDFANVHNVRGQGGMLCWIELLGLRCERNGYGLWVMGYGYLGGAGGDGLVWEEFWLPRMAGSVSIGRV